MDDKEEDKKSSISMSFRRAAAAGVSGTQSGVT